MPPYAAAYARLLLGSYLLRLKWACARNAATTTATARISLLDRRIEDLLHDGQAVNLDMPCIRYRFRL